MKTLKYLGPYPEVTVPLQQRSIKVAKGETIEVPGKIADELLARGKSWKLDTGSSRKHSTDT